RAQLGGNAFHQRQNWPRHVRQPPGCDLRCIPRGSRECRRVRGGDGEALLAALKSSPDYRRVAYPTGFGHIQCSPPFALGATEGTVQSSGVLFRRDGSRWTVLDVGSAIDCAQYGVTADDALEGCVV